MKEIRLKIIKNPRSPKIPLFELLEDLYFKLPEIGSIVVEQGFKTDFSSVPVWLWSIFSPVDERARCASIVHDHLYIYRRRFESLYPELKFRKHADLIFWSMMIDEGMPKIKAYLMYLGVRIGGRKWYDRN